VTVRTIAIGTVLAVLGLAAAVGIGLAANAISDDSVGLSAQPLSAGDSLAPKSEDRATRQPKRGARKRRETESSAPATAPQPAPTAPAPAPAEPGDDHGGDRGGGGNSGPGSGSSGSGHSGGSDDD
jgi:hypothetical protein